MDADFFGAFAALKLVLAKHATRLAVKADTAREYTLVTKSASPFPQHKGEPMWFGSIRVGKAYVSFHLMPLYMNPELNSAITPLLKKRMQGKTCFNFKDDPGPEIIDDLAGLTEACLEQWRERKWL